MEFPRRSFASLLAIAIALAMMPLSDVYGLWGTYPNDKEIVVDNWPVAVVKAINQQKRLWGGGSWDMGWSFFCAGDVSGLNRLLKHMAEDERVEFDLVLYAGPCAEHPDPGDRALEIKADWSIRLYPIRDAIYPFRLDQKPGETDQEFHRRYEEARSKLPEFGVTVTVYEATKIDLAKLQIPLKYKMSVLDRLTALADYHNERRDDVKVDPGASTMPTEESMVNTGGGIFGSATEPATTQSGVRAR